jgi:hypothetical protein
MAQLISPDDRYIMKSTTFVKNACFYKDMFAFLDAYNQILSQPKESLPNFCVENDGQFCLEGICLLVKDYASEFGFESLRLTENYLKVLYYTIASFSKDENMPEKKVIEEEYFEYLNASDELADASKKEYDIEKKKYDELKTDYDGFSSKYAGRLIWAKVANVLAIVLFIFSFGVGVIPFVFYSYGKIGFWSSFVIALDSVLVGYIINFWFKKFSEYLETSAGEMAYVLQQKKRVKDEEKSSMQTAKNKYAKILSEKYEYNHNFNEVFGEYQKKLDIAKLVERASEYNLLSYNLKHDIAQLFVSQQKAIEEMTQKIESISKDFEQSKWLAECYKEICAEDWLYFNNEVRFSFIKKFSENAEKTYVWQIDKNGEKVNPFDIDVKKLAKEKISYLKNDGSLFVSATLDKFLNTSYIKNSKSLELKNLKSLDSVKNAKLEYLMHFYDYEKTKSFDNLFYDKKMSGSAVVTQQIREDTQKIPTYILIKLKYIECRLGYENSNYDIIEQIADDISNKKLGESYTVKEEPKESSVEVSDFESEDFGDYVRYNVGGNVFIGYKFV